MGKLTLNESEKTKIRQLHGLNGVDLINEQMDAEIAKIECRKKYGKKSEKLTKRGYTKAEEGENYEEGYKTKTIPNKECVDELWFKAKKSIKDRVRNIGDKYADKKVGKKEDEELSNLNSDVIGNIVGMAIGTSGGNDVVNDIYILASPRKALVSLDRITRGLTIRNKEIKELKTIVKTFKSEATNFWNAVENGLGGNDDVITKQFADKKIRNIKDMFRRNMSAIATRTNSIVGMVNGQLTDGDGACSTAMTKTSVKNRNDYK